MPAPLDLFGSNHVIYDNGLLLTIRKSKTQNGIRNIPLALLLPDDVLQEFKEFFLYRTKQENFYNLFLFKSLDWKLYSSTTVRKDVQEIFESLGYSRFVFHHLRHSFASWFLLRWVAAFYKNVIPKNTPYLAYELFKPRYLSKLRFLLLGADNRRHGQNAFSHVMPALARLMGHGGPIVTLGTCVHNPDWLFFMFSKYNEPRIISVTSRQAADFMQITYPTLPPLFRGKGKKKVGTEDLLNAQRQYLASH